MDTTAAKAVQLLKQGTAQIKATVHEHNALQASIKVLEDKAIECDKLKARLAEYEIEAEKV